MWSKSCLGDFGNVNRFINKHESSTEQYVQTQFWTFLKIKKMNLCRRNSSSCNFTNDTLILTLITIYLFFNLHYIHINVSKKRGRRYFVDIALPVIELTSRH